MVTPIWCYAYHRRSLAYFCSDTMDLQALRSEAIRLEDSIDINLDSLRRLKGGLASAVDVFDSSKRSAWGEDELNDHEKKCTTCISEIERLLLQVCLPPSSRGSQ